MKRYIVISAICFIAFADCLSGNAGSIGEKIRLSGEWKVRLDPDDEGLECGWQKSDEGILINLPGTLDDAGIGDANTVEPDMSTESLVRLRRRYSYVGPAWYSRIVEIPSDWDGRYVRLYLGRVLWESRVFVDGEEKASGESLTVPHMLDLGRLSSGKHLLVIRIDNRMKYKISGKADHEWTKYLSHSYTEETTCIWNGIIGDMYMEPEDYCAISSVSVFPSAEDASMDIKIRLENRMPNNSRTEIAAYVESPEGTTVARKKIKCVIPPGESEKEINMSMEDIELWDEFSPALYKVRVVLDGKGGGSVRETVTGFRDIESVGNILYLNGRRLYLKGEVDCSVFPLTGYTEMQENDWVGILSMYKEYGLNHVRFHSWCPPEAAFKAADSLGIYMYVELPVWAFEVGLDDSTCDFITQEAERILKTYGNHPSFCFMSMGNELDGDFGWIASLVCRLRKEYPGRLYASTTFTFAKGHGTKPEPDDDFLTTQWTDGGWTRCQGVFDYQEPSFSGNFSNALKNVDKPVIVHEIGQYSIFPDLEEIKLYTGNLLPVNLLSVKNDLIEKGRLSKADDYFKATGAFASLLYKAEIEYHLRTPESNGFQLLGLKDFPGQGTAIIGMLNSFGKNKGIVSARDWRSFCGSVVPLMEFDKVVYGKDDVFSAKFLLHNFSDKAIDASVMWSLTDEHDSIIGNGVIAGMEYPEFATAEGGSISVPLGMEDAAVLTLDVRVEGTDYRNSWKIWYYPISDEDSCDYEYVTSVQDLSEKIGKTDRLLYIPGQNAIKGIKTRFTPVFWSAVLFPDQPGTMGILCDPMHPALSVFPTDFHADWQWWYLLTDATAVPIPEEYAPSIIVQALDNIATNRLLSLLFEFEVEGTSVLVCSADLSQGLQDRLPAAQLLKSLVKYIRSEEFDPVVSVSRQELISIIQN